MMAEGMWALGSPGGLALNLGSAIYQPWGHEVSGWNDRWGPAALVPGELAFCLHTSA